jgi:hypothetical protein
MKPLTKVFYVTIIFCCMAVTSTRAQVPDPDLVLDIESIRPKGTRYEASGPYPEWDYNWPFWPLCSMTGCIGIPLTTDSAASMGLKD